MRVDLGDGASANVTPEGANNPQLLEAMKKVTDAVKEQFSKKSMTLTELTALSPDELRVRVAELMGWRFENYGPSEFQKLYWKLYSPSGDLVDDRHTSKSFLALLLPSYPASLDSCREFEDAMTDEEHEEYRKHLRHITAKDAKTFPTTDKSRRAYLSASPLQKCQAYVLTKQATKTKGAE